MAKKRVIVCCADAVATSTLVAGKLRRLFQKEGLDVEIKTCSNLNVRNMAKSFKPDVIVSNVGVQIKTDDNIPVLDGTTLLTGRGSDEVEKEIVSILTEED
ncbi:MAG TPA: hypothetical protein VK031_05930 [Tissierellaceae bacterium]|nr:hypothetical protein [Tissierellaceae bacterium]